MEEITILTELIATLNEAGLDQESVTTIGYVFSFLAFTGRFYGYYIKLKQREKTNESTDGFDAVDKVFSKIYSFAHDFFGNKKKANFARLANLVNSIKITYEADLIAVVKINGIQSVYLDASEKSCLGSIHSILDSELCLISNKELHLEGGLYIGSVVAYKENDNFAKELHEQGVTQAFVFSIIQDELLAGYLFLGYTKVYEKPKLTKLNFNRIQRIVKNIKL